MGSPSRPALRPGSLESRGCGLHRGPSAGWWSCGCKSTPGQRLIPRTEPANLVLQRRPVNVAALEYRAFRAERVFLTMAVVVLGRPVASRGVSVMQIRVSRSGDNGLSG